MRIPAKTILFHISQLLLIIVIIATGMPARAAGMAALDTVVASQNHCLKAIGLPPNPGILTG